MEADFDGSYEDIPENLEESAEEEDGDEDRLQQEVGEVGETGETVDERLWNKEDKPEEGQQGPEKHERDSTVQACFCSCLHAQVLRPEPWIILKCI